MSCCTLNQFYSLLYSNSYSGVGGYTILYSNSKVQIITNIIEYFEGTIDAFDFLSDEDPTILEDFKSNYLKLLQLKDKSPDDIIQKLTIEYGNDENSLIFWGFGTHVLIEIFNFIKDDIKRKFEFGDIELFELSANDEDFENLFLRLIESIENGNDSIIALIEKLNDVLFVT